MVTTGTIVRTNKLQGSAAPAQFSRGRQVAWIVLLSLVLSSLASHLLASWLGVSHPSPGFLGIYRRSGPETGPQGLCAGSSLLVAAFSWSSVSQALGEGIETWGIGGSSPDIWEIWQEQRPFSNLTIIGVSTYDLNEMHLADERATVVPLSRTIKDLWESHADPALAHRILTQYALKYLRYLFPTAGNADKVLVGVRSKAAELLGRQASVAEHEGLVVEPDPPLLEGLQSTASINDWSGGRLQRRIAILRAENRGRHEFSNGPKHMALMRMLLQARQQGQVIVVVLPVSRAYTEAFLNQNDVDGFEREIQQAMATAPDAMLVRLDRVTGITDASYFFDLAHLNSVGRRVATQAFLADVAKGKLRQQMESSSTAATSGGK